MNGTKPLIGLGFLGLSVVFVYGGITGRLAPMLAALFYPSALKVPSGNDMIPLTPPVVPPVTPAAPGGAVPPAEPVPKLGPFELPPGIGKPPLEIGPGVELFPA